MFPFFRKRDPNWDDMTAKERGAYWEKVAADVLKGKGLKIVARNWTSERGELDIVVKDGEILIFVEVRARAAEALVGGYNSIRSHKRDVLRRTCRNYMDALKEKPRTYRFDVIEIAYRSRDDYELRHFENVPLF